MGLVPVIRMQRPNGSHSIVIKAELQRYLDMNWEIAEDSAEENAKEVKDAVDDKDVNEVKEAVETPKVPEAPADNKPADEKPVDEKPADEKPVEEILPE